jgi:hypothetical protein
MTLSTFQKEKEKEFDKKFAWEALRGDLYINVKQFFSAALSSQLSLIKEKLPKEKKLVNPLDAKTLAGLDLKCMQFDLDRGFNECLAEVIKLLEN